MNAGETITITSDDWGFSDQPYEPGDLPNNFVAVTLGSVPAEGQVKVDGVIATIGQEVSMVTIVAGNEWTKAENNYSKWWRSLASSADGTKLLATWDNRFLYGGSEIATSTDSGLTWQLRDIPRSWKAVASSADGTKLVAVVRGGQIYTSSDSGATWTARENNRDWSTVASSADGTTLVAADSGGLSGGLIYTSSDSGATWTARESNRNWASVASSADGNKLVAVVRGGQIYTSSDSGATWTARETARDWVSVASSADGTNLLVAAASGFMSSGLIYTSSDSGATWTARETARDWVSVASSADGITLVAAVRGGQIHTSKDSGVTWTAGGTSEEWRCVASSADGNRLAAVYGGDVQDTQTVGTTEGFLCTSVGYPMPVITYTAPLEAGTNTLSFQVQDDGEWETIDLSPNILTFVVPSYLLDTEAGPHGSVNVGDQSLPAGTTAQITATAEPYFYFTNWTGNVSDEEMSTNPLNLLMDTNKTVTANFTEQVTANTGTPHWWMAEYGITQNFEQAALEDPNSNGYTTAEDYIIGLDPVNPASTFRMGTDTSPEGMTLSWPSVAGRVYDIETNDTLSESSVWTVIAGGENITASPPTNSFFYPKTLMTKKHQFFRIKVRLQEE